MMSNSGRGRVVLKILLDFSGLINYILITAGETPASTAAGARKETQWKTT